MSSAVTDLFDPQLVPSLLPRVEGLCALLVQAAQDAHSLTRPDGTAAPGDNEAATGVPTNGTTGDHPQQETERSVGENLPSFLLGATLEEEQGYEAEPTSTRSGAVGKRPTELQLRIVKEAQGLRDTLKRTATAIAEMPGADRSLDEQAKLIELLEAQLDRQV